MREEPETLDIAIVGAGRVGKTLLGYLETKKPAHVRVVAVTSRTEASLIESKDMLQDQRANILFTLDKREAARRSNCVLICTPDDLIQQTCEDLFDKTDGKGLCVMHVSGSKNIEVLRSAEEQGAATGCMHPIKSFASSQEAVKTLKGTTYGLTYQTKKAETVLKKMVRALDGKYIIVLNESKPLYHAMTCIASNYLVSLADYALGMAPKIGVSISDILEPILALSEGTLANIRKMGTKKALTGPIARGDLSTICQHVEAIQRHAGEEQAGLYKVLGRHTCKIAKENHWIDEDQYRGLIEILQ